MYSRHWTEPQSKHTGQKLYLIVNVGNSSSISECDDYCWLEEERVATLAVMINAGVQSVDVEEVKGFFK